MAEVSAAASRGEKIKIKIEQHTIMAGVWFGMAVHDRISPLKFLERRFRYRDMAVSYGEHFAH